MPRSDDLLVEVHRKVGDSSPRQDVIALVAERIGKGNIRISDRRFGAFVVVAVNEMATGWSVAPKSLPAASGQAHVRIQKHSEASGEGCAGNRYRTSLR